MKFILYELHTIMNRYLNISHSQKYIFISIHINIKFNIYNTFIY